MRSRANFYVIGYKAEEVIACEQKWHKTCLKCHLPGCKRVVAKGGYLEKKDEAGVSWPYCEKPYVTNYFFSLSLELLLPLPHPS